MLWNLPWGSEPAALHGEEGRRCVTMSGKSEAGCQECIKAAEIESFPHAWSPLSGKGSSDLRPSAHSIQHTGMCEVNRMQEPWEMKTRNEATCVLLCLDQWSGWLWRCVTGPRESVLNVVVEGEPSKACGTDSTLCPVYLEIRRYSFHLDTRRYFKNKQVCHSLLQGKER